VLQLEQLFKEGLLAWHRNWSSWRMLIAWIFWNFGRRVHADLIEVYKIVHGLSAIPF